MFRNPALPLGLAYGLVSLLVPTGGLALCLRLGALSAPEAILLLAAALLALRPDRALGDTLPALLFTAGIQVRAEAAMARGLKEAKGILILEGRPRDKLLFATLFLDGIGRRISAEGLFASGEREIVEAQVIRELRDELAPREIVRLFARLSRTSFSPVDPHISHHDLLRIRARRDVSAAPVAS